MAFKDSDLRAAVEPHLEENEQLKHCAFGVKQPNILLIVLLCLLALLPGLIAIVLLTMNYIVALTDRRFLVLRFKGKLNVVEISEYPLESMPEVAGNTGPIFTHIRIKDAQQPFVAKFHRAGTKANRAESSAIVAALAGS